MVFILQKGRGNTMNSVVRYFGGKGNGLKEIIYGHFPEKSSYHSYIEVFGGGASLLFHKEPFGIEMYNDLEQNVYSLFKVLSDRSLFPKFKEMCDLSLYSRQLRDEYKQDLKREDIDIVERAYKYFYVNRSSINSIGGFSVSTECIRRNMSKSVSDFLSTIDGLRELHNRLSRVIIENMDGIELIKKYDRMGTFMYLDPPYHHITRGITRYKVDMSNEQQKELISTLIDLKHTKILLSGYDCKEYERLTKNGWKKLKFDVKTQDGNRNPKTKTEVLWKNYTDKNNQDNTLWSL
jgi:DNA adenine methylase